MSLSERYVALDDQLGGRTRLYADPVEVVTAWEAHEVMPALQRLDELRRTGRHLAGWLGYGVGAAVEDALESQRRGEGRGEHPLLQVGVFEGFGTALPDELTQPDAELTLPLRPVWSEASYREAFARVQGYIHAGDVYQVNLTFPLRGQTELSADALYRNLRGRQRGAFGGVAVLGGTEIVSLSPELFMQVDGGTATLRPMKGTLARDTDDGAARDDLQSDPKSRAENLMIVDLLRNDLSRIAEPGSVEVPELFSVETYPTLHQMTSTVTGRVGDAGLKDIVAALFPCGSVTGAPKIRAMEIIRELEPAPRGPYCGSLFFMEPSGDCAFSVLIRTLVKRGREVSYGVGSGVVSDSEVDAEWRECLLKAEVLKAPTPSLVETFKLGPKGYVRITRHLNRLERSARELGWPMDFQALMAKLAEVESDESDQRIRLELFPDRRARITVTPLRPKVLPLKAVAGSRPVSPLVQPSAHKSSARSFYTAELDRAREQGADEAILLNAAGEVCEGTWTSVFAELGGRLLTPPLSSGLLPGVLREHLLESGAAEEGVLHWDDLLRADALYLGNSLRGLMLAELV